MNKQGRQQLREIATKLASLQAAVTQAEGTDNDYISRLACITGIEDDLDGVRSEIEDMKSDEEGKLDNMSESLRDGSTGEAIQNAIDNLDEAVCSIEDVMGHIAQASQAAKAWDRDSSDVLDEDDMNQLVQDTNDEIQNVIDFLQEASA